MSSVSQRLVLVGVDESLQISQKPQSRKCQELAKMGNLDMCENHPRGRSLVENLSVNADEREPMVKSRLKAAADQQVDSSRVGRFSAQSAAAACIENQTQRVQPRAPVGRGLRELSPGSNLVNHSRNNQPIPGLSSLDLAGKSYDNVISRHLPSIESPLSETLSLNTKADQKNPKTLQNRKSLAKSGYKEPKTKQEFSSFFLHFATPRPFYRAHSFI